MLWAFRGKSAQLVGELPQQLPDFLVIQLGLRRVLLGGGELLPEGPDFIFAGRGPPVRCERLMEDVPDGIQGRVQAVGEVSSGGGARPAGGRLFDGLRGFCGKLFQGPSMIVVVGTLCFSYGAGRLRPAVFALK